MFSTHPCSVKGDLIGWEQKRHREQDWVETEVIKSVIIIPIHNLRLRDGRD